MKKSQPSPLSWSPLHTSIKNPKSKFKNACTRFHSFTLLTLLTLCTVPITGCQILSYSAPNGERFTRSSLGTTTSISSLKVEADTNGLRRVELQGYQNDSTQALGVVTDAAVKAALQSIK